MGKYRFDEIAVNSTEKKKPEKADKHTYIGLEHLDPGRLQVTRYGSDVAPIGEKLIMRKGDVLFGKRRAYQKKVAIAPFDGIFSAHGMVLRPNEKVIDRDFFPFFISSDYFLDAAIAISVGSLSPTINWRDLRELEFELPNLVKQRELAKIFSALEETKKSYRKLLQLSDELVKSQFVEMFGGFSEWTDTHKLGDICDSISDGSHNPPKGVDYSRNLMISSKNIRDGQITIDDPRYLSDEEFEQENKRTNVKPGDVLLTIVGAIGRVAVVPETIGRIALQRSVAVLHIYKERILPVFMMYMLKELFPVIDAEAHGIAQRGIYLAQVNALDVICPPIKLQEQFVTIAIQSDKSRLEIEHSLAELIATSKKLLAESFE